MFRKDWGALGGERSCWRHLPLATLGEGAADIGRFEAQEMKVGLLDSLKREVCLA